MRPRRVEIWSDLQCDGGTRLAVFRGALSAQETRQTSGLPQLSFTYPAAATAHAQVREWRVIRFDYSDSSFDEWVIVGVGELRSDLRVTLTCAGPGVKLANVMVSRSDADGTVMLDFEAPALTPTQQLTNFILPPATAAGMHFTLGTVDPTGVCDMRYGFGQDAGWDSAWSALQRLAQVVRNPTGGPCEVDIRRNGTSGYIVDFLNQIGASATTFDVRFRRNLPDGWKRDRSTNRQATRIFPRGSETDGVAATIARARWKVTAKSSNTLTLADPAGSDGPVGFDSQLNGLYVRRIDGTLTQVSTSTASSQQVVVADATGITVGDLIEFRRTSAGDYLTYLEHPAAKTTYGLIGKTLARPDLPVTVNLGDNTVCREYAGGSSSLPDRWTPVGGASFTKNTTDFTRIRYGAASFRLQGVNDGDGADTPYSAVKPTAASPIFPGFIGFWLDAGQVRVELIVAKDPASVTSIARSGTTATVTMGAAHGLAKGDRVEILGANETAYNGIRLITSVPSSTTFTYDVTGSPSTPATGTITAAWCRRIPEGTEGWAGTNETKRWKELGVDDQATNLNALAATRAKFRIVQDGSTPCDVYVNYYQITQSPTQLPFVDGSGPAKLWQEGNRYLKAYNAPLSSYTGSALNLQELDPLTWPWGSAAPTLGGPIKVTDDYYGVVSTRILALQRDPFNPVVTGLTLSDDPGDLIDILVGDRRPSAQPKSVKSSIDPSVEWTLTRPAATPGIISVRLSARPDDRAPIYYWIGGETQAPPSQSLVQAGAPSDTLWGTYSVPFGVNQVQSTDLRVWTYCQSGGSRGKPRSFRVEKDTLPSIVSLQLQEAPSLNLKVNWTPDDDVRAARVYVAVGDWPVTQAVITSLTRVSSTATAVTSAPHNLVTGDSVKVSGAAGSAYNIEATVTVVDAYTFTYTVSGTPTTPDTGTSIRFTSGRCIPLQTDFKAEMAVDPSGGGTDSSGAAIAGGTEYKQASGFSNSDKVYVVVVPIDWRGNVGPANLRGVAKLTMAAATDPTITSMAASRTAEGTACDSTHGAQYTFTWAQTDLVDGTHKVVIFAGDSTTTETNPASNLSATVRVPFQHTFGKWDPLITIALSWQLLDGSNNVIQSGTLPSNSFTSSCEGGV